MQRGLRDDLLARLVSQGLVREERRRALGVLQRTVWPAMDPSYESRLRAGLSQVLVLGVEPTKRIAALVSLLAAVDAVAKVVPSDDNRAVKRRAKEISQGEWAGVAVRKAIEAVMPRLRRLSLWRLLLAADPLLHVPCFEHGDRATTLGWVAISVG